MYRNMPVLSVFSFANELSHGSHRTVNTPAAGSEQYHGHKPQYGGCEQHTVKTEGKLGDSFMEQSSVISPMPWQSEGPQECDCLF